jgi:hypothetical protein
MLNSVATGVGDPFKSMQDDVAMKDDTQHQAAMQVLSDKEKVFNQNDQ